jgi:hypothetical protein
MSQEVIKKRPPIVRLKFQKKKVVVARKIEKPSMFKL